MDIEQLMSAQGYVEGQCQEPSQGTFEDQPNDSVISYNQEPTTEQWWLEPLYQGNQIWQIGFDGQQLVIRHGYIGGSIQVKHRAVVLNNSGRTIQQQALVEARQRYWKQEHKGYTNQHTDIPQHPKPMLANKYEPKKIKAFPILVQPKIDGIRCLAHMSGGQVHLRTRTNMTIYYMDHVRAELALLFQMLPRGCHLDGELYVHGWSFNKLTSVIRTGQVSKSTKAQRDKHELSDQVGYWIFDIISSDPAPIRQQLLDQAYEAHPDLKSILVVPATLCYSHDELMSFYQCYVDNGYEGAMVRHTQGKNRNGVDLTTYRDKRSDNLLKVKKFQDEEGLVVDVIEGAGSEQGLAILVIQDQRGNTFPVRPEGSFELRCEWFQNKAQLLGKKYTFRYFELSDYGVPRFPTGVAFRDYE